ncbi:hypothetical protein CVV65_06890 [Kyrpidia spormannii]|uniref:L,D-TPase catalytic domain-containing protein n=1 Tax=Kyrpidia spormannii TaxID=2055160 RepID=A0A2K8N5Q4_9BACL|nr:L,D-transpeptidase family protein [Kyrpidia spormannii]ATY84689.1 hypothetical protein CVV65_06890 [Kyrpidia spormannii]
MRALRITLCVCILVVLGLGGNVHVRAESGPLMQIEVNTDTHRLTVYRDGIAIKQYPVALGRPDSPTPIGNWKLINKYKNWGGGFGTRWLGLNVPWGIYGIHGTNRPHSIGWSASAGCIRMRNRDVEELYEMIRVGTPVRIVGDPLQYMRRLKDGDIGTDVWLVQDRLLRLGFYRGPCNGRFSLSTQAALKAFERSQHLPVDGVVSVRDYHALGLIE